MTPEPPFKGRILFGEDVRLLAPATLQQLTEAGYLVDFAEDGEECLRRARAEAPDLLVLDIIMPKLHGITVLRTLREDPATEHLGVIVCTARDFKADLAECARLGVHDYLVKPFEPAALLDKIMAFFKMRGAVPATNPESSIAAKPAPEVFTPEFDRWGNRFALWGCRGSTPTPGATFLRHGGNTSCFAVSYGDDKFIFDAGTGIRDLGMELMAGPRRKIHLFVTHTHWDHIQGFPFFTPAYVPGFDITVWGAELFGKDLKSVFRGQLDRDYFPVQMEDMNADLVFRHLSANPIMVGDVAVWWEYSQHPGATVGYKIDLGGYKIGWVPDNEFLQGYTGAPEELTRDHAFVAPYRKMIQFLSDVDVLVHEAQYTSEEYATKIGWGHSSISNACMLMKFAGVKRWIITHHDPSHDDIYLERKLAITRQMLERIGHDCHVTHGYDGLTYYF